MPSTSRPRGVGWGVRGVRGVGALHIRMGLPAGLFAREVLQPMFEVRLAGVCGRLTFPLFSEKLPQTLLWFVLTFILHLGFRFSLCYGRRSGGTLSYRNFLDHLLGKEHTLGTIFHSEARRSSPGLAVCTGRKKVSVSESLNSTANTPIFLGTISARVH